MLLIAEQRVCAAGEDTSTMKGSLWYQGQIARYQRFFDHIRSDPALCDLPIVQMTLASGAWPFIGSVSEDRLGM